MGIRRFNDSNGRWAPVLTHVDAVMGLDGRTLSKILEEMENEIGTATESIISYTSSPTTINAEVNSYYRIDADVDTLTVTLPSIEDSTKVVGIIFLITVGTTPAITLVPSASSGGTTPSVYYKEGYVIEAGKTYEINCLWNGAAWIVASIEIEMV